MTVIMPVAALLLAACSGDPAIDALHRTADSLMAERPDSALLLLNTHGSILPSSGEEGQGWWGTRSSSRRQLMRHELLRARAMNKAYVNFTTDSVMKLVADYYDSHGTPNERMEAHYLLGCTYRDMGEAPQALQCYQYAVEQADTNSDDCDFGLLARIYGQIGYLFRSQSLFRNALVAFQSSNRYAWMNNDTLTAVLAYGQFADCYYGLGDTDSTLVVFDETYKLLTEYGYSSHANTFLSIPIYILLSREEYQRARQYLDIYEHSSALAEPGSGSIVEFKKLYYYKGLYYAGTERKDSAAFCFRLLASQSGSVYDKMLAYSGLYSIYRQSNNRDSIDKYVSLYKESLDSNQMIVETSRLQDLQSLYNYTRHQTIATKEAKRAENMKFWLIVSVLASLVLLLLAWLVIKYIREEDKRRLKQMSDKYLASILEYKFLKAEQTEIKKQKDKLSNDFEEAKMVLSQGSGYNMEEWDMEDAILYMPIISRIHQQATQNKMVSDMLWNELIESVRPLMPNFMSAVENFNLRNGSKGYKLCILTRLHFSLSEICVLLGMSSQALNNMRRRMNIKLFGGEGEAHLFDENVLHIHR